MSWPRQLGRRQSPQKSHNSVSVDFSLLAMCWPGCTGHAWTCNHSQPHPAIPLASKKAEDSKNTARSAEILIMTGISVILNEGGA
ncbi:hypothetical protein Ddc_02340 [Ditylenchus destructor]|nr:hypothetical protein Ddc_02340 [Ditylenchus destructor]